MKVYYYILRILSLSLMGTINGNYHTVPPPDPPPGLFPYYLGDNFYSANLDLKFMWMIILNMVFLAIK